MYTLPESSNRANKADYFAYLLFCIAITGVLITRAFLVPVTHDEATTFYNYVLTGDFIPFMAKGEANNHPLNSFLTYLFYHLFGNHTIVLRLANLLALPFYLLIIFKLSCKLKSRLIRWVFLICMAGTFHMMEFFALSRGYGLSLTFLMAALYQSLLLNKTKSSGHTLLMNLFLILASLSILLNIYNFALLIGWNLLCLRYKNWKQRGLSALAIIVTGLIPLYFLIKLTLYLKTGGAYIERGSGGIWNSTMVSLVEMISDFNPVQSNQLLRIICLYFMILLLSFLGISVWKRRFRIEEALVFPYMLFGNLAIIIIVALYFFSDYPQGRLVLYIFPLVFLSILFLLDRVSTAISIGWLNFLSLPVLLFPLLSISQIQFEYVQIYYRCHVPMRFYNEIMDDNKSGEFPTCVAGHGIQAYSWSFLCRQKGSIANELCDAEFPSRRLPYEIIDLQYFSDWKKHYDTIDFDPVSNLHLLKNKTAYRKVEIKRDEFPSGFEKTDREFFELSRKYLSEFGTDSIRLDIDLSFDSFNNLLNGNLVIEINDSSHQNLIYDEIHLNWARDKWDGTAHNFRRSWIFPKLPEKAAYIKIYFWNAGKREYRINAGNLAYNRLTVR